MPGAVDIATLGLEVKSTGLPEAVSGLGGVEQSAAKTEAATLKMSDAMTKALTAVSGMSTAAVKAASAESTNATSADQNAAATVKMAQAQEAAATAHKKNEESVQKASEVNMMLSNSYKTLIGWVEKLAVAFGLYKIADMIKDVVMMAARYDTLGVVVTTVGNNAGYTRAQMAGFQAELEKANISAIEARQSLARMGEGQVDFAHSVELANVAKNAAVIADTNSSEAFSRMITGIATGQSIILHHMGLMTNFETAYVRTANTLGKTTNELTETEKSTARVNEVLRAGAAIAGVYDAALDTTGKQINSLKRYVDNLKVAWGSVFQDSLLIATKALTAELKDTNSETQKLAQAEELKQWGRNMVMTFAAIGDGISFVTKSIHTVTGLAVASTMQLFSLVAGVWKAMKFDFSGAGESFKNINAYGAAWNKDRDKTWNDKSYQQSAADMYAERDARAASDKAAADAAEAQKIALAEKAKAEKAAAEEQELREKQFLSSIKDSISGIKSYTAALKDAGAEKLHFSEEQFADALKKEGVLITENRVKVDELLKPLITYNSTIQSVFAERDSIEREGLNKIADLYVKFRTTVLKNISTKDAQKDGVNILNEYKTVATEMIGVEQDRYKVLLEGERKYANEISTIMKAKKQELIDLQNFFRDANKVFHEKMATTLGGSYLLGSNAYLDPNLNAYDRRNANIEMLTTKEAAADAITDPKAKLSELKSVYEDWGKMTNAVIVDGATILTQEDAFKIALTERQRLEQKMTEAVQRQQAELESAYKASEDRLQKYKDRLEELDTTLRNMTTKIDLTLQVHGYEQITAIQQFLTQARNSPIIGMTPGQQVAPAQQSPSNPPAGGNVTLAGDINVNMPNVTNITPSTSNDIARNVLPSIQEYNFRML